MLRNRGIIGISIFLALAASVWVTFLSDWWEGYRISNINYLLILGVISITFLIFKNKIKYICLTLVLLLINYAGIGSTLTVLLFWTTAYLIGKKLFSLITSSDDAQSKFLENSALGFSIIGLIVTISSHFQINIGLYYLALMVVFYSLTGSSEIIDIFHSIKRHELIKIDFVSMYFLIICIGYLYMVTVVPDLGHDSLSMHLNVPRLISENHKWNYDVNEYVWSVLPMGVDMLYVPTYIFGGENAIRILNLSFILASTTQIYLIAKRYYCNENIAILFGIVFLSMPIIAYLLGSSFVEPCYIFFVLITFSLFLDKVIYWNSMAIIFGYACTMRITGVLFLPAIFVFYLYSHIKHRIKIKNLIYTALIFSLFSLIPYTYAYILTGNPVFPLMNEIFKSDLWSKSAFYHPFYVNNHGLANLWYMIFDSKKYGEFAANGTIGIVMAIVIPFPLIYLIYHWKKFSENKSEICILVAGLLYVISMIYVQAYLRYIFPGLVLIYLSFIVILAKVHFNLNLIKYLLLTFIFINLLKIPYASTYFPNEFEIYYDKNARLKYISHHRPYAIVGDILKKFPEYNNSKILLVGYGYDPVYYYYPKNTIAYSWHSPQAFNVINSLPDDLGSSVIKLGVDIIVCPNIQNKDDVRNFSIQCKSISSKLFVTNGVYVGEILRK